MHFFYIVLVSLFSLLSYHTYSRDIIINRKDNTKDALKKNISNDKSIINDLITLEYHLSQLSIEEKIAQLFILKLSNKKNIVINERIIAFIKKYGAAALVYDNVTIKSALYDNLRVQLKLSKPLQPLIGISINEENNIFLNTKELIVLKNKKLLNNYADTLGYNLINADTDFIWMECRANDIKNNAQDYTSIFNFASRLQKLNLATIAYIKDNNFSPDSTFYSSFLGINLNDTTTTSLNNINSSGYDGLLVSGYNLNDNNNETILKMVLEKDLISFPDDPEYFLNEIKKMLNRGDLSEKVLNQKVIKVLEKKAKLQVKNYNGIPSNIETTLESIKNNVIAACIHLKQNKNVIPLSNLDKYNFRYKIFSINKKNNISREDFFIKHLRYFIPVQDEQITYGKNKNIILFAPIFLNDFNDLTIQQQNIALKDIRSWRTSLGEKVSVIWNIFGHEAIDAETITLKSDVILNIPFDTESAIKNIISYTFNGFDRNSVNLIRNTKESDSIQHNNKNHFFTKRLTFALPEQVGMDSYLLNESIDKIVNHGIKKKAFPGAQVLVARHGQVVYYKGFGNGTYDKTSAVITQNSVFDLASLTKVIATNQVIMHLYANDSLDINKSLGDYLPELSKTNKKDITIKDVLLHCGGLPPIVKVKRLLSDKRGRLKKKYFSNYPYDDYYIPLTANLFANKASKEFILEEIKKLPFRRAKYKKGAIYTYRYSDIGFFLLQKICENITKTPIEVYLKKNLYDKIGASSLTFNPLNASHEGIISRQSILNQVPPTEIDFYFRKGKIQGIVNDPLAAIVGGVGGHAGLFGNALDIAKVLELSRKNGYYGDLTFYDKKTFDTFNKYYVPGVRRGLGWDKPYYNQPENISVTHIPDAASLKTFGHLGFTGTSGWVDPKKGLIIVFLSNRTYPNANNSALQEYEIRKKIFAILYKSIESYNLQNSIVKLTK